MALIICSECGKEYSDRADACPNCACPSPRADCSQSSARESTTKNRYTFRSIIIPLIIFALLAVAIKYMYKSYLHSSGLNAMHVGDYSTARDYLEELNYEDSELILNDISFLEDLEEIVNEEISSGSEIEHIMNTAENNLKKIQKYKATEFYTDGLSRMVNQYIEGLEKIISAFDMEAVISAQYETLLGKYYCDFVVVELHDKLGFMQNSPEYAQVYTDIIPEEEALLTAFQELSEKGNVVTKDGDFWSGTVKLYLRNDTEYKFDQTYQFDFYNYKGDTFLESVTVDVLGIEPYAEYTVSINVPWSALNGYSVNYSYYFLDITIPD